MILSEYINLWEVISQFALLNGLYADICILRIGAVQAEHLCIFRSLCVKKLCNFMNASMYPEVTPILILWSRKNFSMK